jgi:hypothetical protein
MLTFVPAIITKNVVLMLRGMVMDPWIILKDVWYVVADFPWWVWLTLVGLLLLMWVFMKK